VKKSNLSKGGAKKKTGQLSKILCLKGIQEKVRKKSCRGGNEVREEDKNGTAF